MTGLVGDFELGSTVETVDFGQFTVEEVVQVRPLAARYRVARGSFRRYWMDAPRRATRDRLAVTPHESELARISELAHESILSFQCLSRTVGPEAVPVLFMATGGCPLASLQPSPEDGVRSFSVAAPIGLNVLSALDELHALGIVHDDVTPDSIFVQLRRPGDVRVALGLRIEMVYGASFPDPAYCAPERLRGEMATPRSDLYSLGAVLYEQISGAPPFPNPHRRAASPEIKPRPLSDLSLPLPRGLAEIVMRALEPNPDARPEDASTFAEAFADAFLDAQSAPRFVH